MLSLRWISLFSARRRLTEQPAFLMFHAANEGDSLRYPRLYDTGSPVGKKKPDAARCFMQREVILRYRQLILFRLFYEADGNLGMHLPNACVPVETGTPPFNFY